MTVKIHHLLTGELESSYSTSVFGAPEQHPHVTKQELLPFGHQERQYKDDGSFEPGLMVPVPIWLIEGEQQCILIDTGLGDVNEIMELQGQYGIDYIARKTKEQEIDYLLNQKGLTTADIDLVVLTHLHFDHIGNNDKFPNAKFIVQADEVPLLLNPPDFATFYYREWSHKIYDIRDRLEIINGNLKLGKHLELLKTGGHTPGQMVVMANTEEGTVCLASDFLYNYINVERGWPMGPIWNMTQWIEGYRYLTSQADIIVPNHDYQFFEYYPNGIIG